MKRRAAQILSQISFFVGMASLAGWLFFFPSFAVGELNEVTPLPEVIIYSVAGGVLSAASLGVIALVPAARNTHGLAALAAVTIAAVDAAFLVYTFADLTAITYVLTTGTLGGFQTLAAIVAVILAALSFPAMKGTKVFDRRDSRPNKGEGQAT